MIANDWPMIGSDWLWLRLMASDARRRLATAGSWATCASLRTATPSAALWASPCSRAWVSRSPLLGFGRASGRWTWRACATPHAPRSAPSTIRRIRNSKADCYAPLQVRRDEFFQRAVRRGRPCAAPMPVCCCGACRLPTRREVTRRWPLGLSRSAVYPSTQPSCTSTRRDAPCWGRRFVTRAVSVTFGCRFRPSAADRAGARRCAARFVSCAFGEDENQTQVRVSGPTMHLAYAYPGPEITHRCTARESPRLRPSRCGLIRPPGCLVAAEACTHIHTCARGGVSLRLRRVALELTETTRSRAPCTPPSARSNRRRCPQKRIS